jgi:hypothetical protein
VQKVQKSRSELEVLEFQHEQMGNQLFFQMQVYDCADATRTVDSGLRTALPTNSAHLEVICARLQKRLKTLWVGPRWVVSSYEAGCAVPQNTRR